MEHIVLRRVSYTWSPHEHQYAYKPNTTTDDALAHLHDTVKTAQNTFAPWFYEKKTGGLQMKNGPQPASMLAFHRGYVESKLLQGAAIPQTARDDCNGNRIAIEALCVTQRRSLRATTGLLQSTDPECVPRDALASDLGARQAQISHTSLRKYAADVVRVRPPPASTQHTEKASVRRFDGLGSEDGDDNI
eukprot:PhM_4_TR13914/c1_g4_i1/m.40008